MIEFDYSDENIKRTIQKNYFGRNAYIDALIRYIDGADEFSAFAIDGEWGTGKTVFIKQFMLTLKDQELLNNADVGDVSYGDIEALYYNAWENELLKKPSIALLNDLMDQNQLLNLKESEVFKDIGKRIADIALRLSTVGSLDINSIIPEKKEGQQEIDVESIRNLFQETIEYIKNKTNCKKVVIIIDELDRCKPTHVVQLLEEIKHFYDHKDLCVIFSADFTQIGYTIQKLYGDHFDSSLYLQRFFDTTFSLTTASYEKYIEEELGYGINGSHIINEICKVAISYYSLTIRETNKFIKRIKVILKDLDTDIPFEPDINLAKLVFVPWGIALKFKDLNKYHEFMEGGFSKKEIEQFVSSDADLPKWINDCYKDRQAQSEEFDIVQKLYEIYAETFRSRGLRYHGENYDVLRNRARIATYIEF